MDNTKQYRILEIFFRSLRGEDISIRKLADEYGVSTKSISRNISDLKSFLADNRELVGNTELEYSHKDKCYRLYMDEFLRLFKEAGAYGAYLSGSGPTIAAIIPTKGKENIKKTIEEGLSGKNYNFDIFGFDNIGTNVVKL